LSLNIRLKLLTVLPKLLNFGVNQLQDVLRQFPEAKTRSAVLELYDEKGKVAFWIGFEGGRPTVREVDPDNPPYATNVITMHVDTFIRIIRGGLDFRTAYLYDLIEIASNDGLPPAYHLLIWSAFFDRLASSLR